MGDSPADQVEQEGAKLFTLEEANALLPRVQWVVEQIQARTQDAAELQVRLEKLRERKRRGEHVDGEARIVTDVMTAVDRIGRELRAELGRLQELGCELKDVRMGLVDFRSLRDDRVVYLCWRMGEERIEYWHELDTGFAGRQPL
jgi:hypothetical protein